MLQPNRLGYHTERLHDKKLPLRLVFLFSLPVHSNIKTPSPEDSPARASSTAVTSTSGMQNISALLRLNSVLLSLKKAVKTWPTDQESHECELRVRKQDWWSKIIHKTISVQASKAKHRLCLSREHLPVWFYPYSRSKHDCLQNHLTGVFDWKLPLLLRTMSFFSWWKFFCHKMLSIS